MAIRSSFDVAVANLLTASATKILTGTMSRGSVLIANRGPNTIYIAPTEAKCTTVLGFPIPANGSVELDETNGDVWAIVETANQVSPANTRILTS